MSAALSSPNADDALEWLDKDFPVANGSSARGANDGAYRGLDERFRAGHLDLDLFVKLQEQPRASPHRHSVLLTAMTTGARDGDSGDAGAEQCFFDSGEAVGDG